MIMNYRSKELPTDIYFYGFDLLPWLSFYNLLFKCRLIFEIADLRDVFLRRSLFARSMRWFINLSLRFVPVVVLTSEMFVNRFSEFGKIPFRKYFVIENKVHLADNYLDVQDNEEEVWVIGYFGVIRCPRSIEVLLKLLDESDNFRLLIYGYFNQIPESLLSMVHDHPKISYNGTYKSPQDLKKLYSQIDLSWVAYPFSDPKIDGNYRYAWTNRYYEAGFFRKPMIGNRNSGDAIKIEKNGFGITLNLDDLSGSVEDLKNLTKKELSQWKSNLEQSPVDKFRFSDKDHTPLISYLKNNNPNS